MVSLAGLSAVYPGYQKAEGEGTVNDINKFKLQDAQTQQAGQQAFGNTIKMFQAQLPGAQPMQGTQGMQPMQQAPQPPMPGQSSAPGAGQASPAPPAFPGAGQPMRPPMQQGGMPQGQPQGMQQGGSQQQGAMDWRQIAQAVTKANPGAKPEVIAAAVNQFLPLMNAQAQQEWKQVQLQMSRDRLEETRRYHDESLGQRRSQQSLNPNRIALDRYMQENPNASSEDISGFLKKLHTSAATDDKREKVDAAKSNVQSQIDEALTQLTESKKGGPKVTGMVGTARRLYEGIGGNLGFTDQTSASDFETKIRLIQDQVPRLLAGTSRISAAERAKMDDIVRGLSKFTSADQAISSLKYLKNVLSGSVSGAEVQRPTFKDGNKPLTPDIKNNAMRAMKTRGWSKEDVMNTLREHGYDTRGF